jgi:hypothetical protein
VNSQRQTPMPRPRIALACLVTAFVIAGCGNSTSPAEGAASPESSAPDRASLALAVNIENYRDQQSGTSGSAFIVPASCVAGVQWDGTLYVIRSSGQLEGTPDPQPAEPLEGAVVPGCNDTGGTSEPDRPTEAWAIEGVDPERAIFVQFP